MISEAQKKLVFNINCYYQIVGLQKDIQSGEDVKGPAEISMYQAHHTNPGEPIDWQGFFNNLLTALMDSGLSDDWILKLSQCTSNFVGKGGSIHQFKQKFFTSIYHLSELVQATATHLGHLQMEDIVNSVVGDIFDKEYWEGEVAEQVRTIRILESELGLSKEWAIEYALVYMQT